MRVITLYLLKEFIPDTFLGLIVFTFIMVMDRIFEIINLIINRGLSILSLFKLLFYVLPSLLSFSIPMAVLAGCLFCFGRLSNNNEITAMKSSGLSILSLVKPLIFLSLILSVFLVYFNSSICPRTRFIFKNLYYRFAQKNPTIKMEEKTFVTFGKYKFYASRINEKKKKIENVIIYQLQNQDLPLLITAKEGFWKNKNDTLSFHLFNGSIQKKNKKNPIHYNRIYFNKYMLNVNLKRKSSHSGKRIREMEQKELLNEIKRLKKNNIPTFSLRMELWQRSSFAFATLVFLLIGIPLGIKTHIKGKSIGLGLSFLLTFIYYFLLVLGITLGERRILSPFLSTWMANITTGTAGIYLLYKQR